MAAAAFAIAGAKAGQGRFQPREAAGESAFVAVFENPRAARAAGLGQMVDMPANGFVAYPSGEGRLAVSAQHADR